MKNKRVPVNNNTLRAKRLHKGVSLKDAAEYVGVSPPTLTRWEEGYSTPKLVQTMKLADCYGCNVRLFLTETARVIWDHISTVLLLGAFSQMDEMEEGGLPNMDMHQFFGMAERMGMLDEVEEDVVDITPAQDQLSSEIM